MYTCTHIHTYIHTSPKLFTVSLVGRLAWIKMGRKILCPSVSQGEKTTNERMEKTKIKNTCQGIGRPGAGPSSLLERGERGRSSSERSKLSLQVTGSEKDPETDLPLSRLSGGCN